MRDKAVVEMHTGCRSGSQHMEEVKVDECVHKTLDIRKKAVVSVPVPTNNQFILFHSAMTKVFT